MSKRERLEDLGRICEKLDQLSNHEVWQWNEHYRNKDTAEWFQELSKEKQFDKIHSLAYALSNVYEQICEMHQIARYGDQEDEDLQ